MTNYKPLYSKSFITPNQSKTYEQKLCIMIQKSSYSIKNSKQPQNPVLNVGQLKEENEKERKKKLQFKPICTLKLCSTNT